MIYSKNKIRKAGEKLKIHKQDNEALKILSYWRTTHIASLEIAYEYLRASALRVDKRSLLAKRLKRTPSIINKLIRFNKEGMKLDRMNDIGGCRAILPTVSKVEQVTKHLLRLEGFILQKDYINHPKNSGYRGIHLVAKIKNNEKDYRPIELQLRTKIQHSWATAIEIVDLFTDQSIKTNSGGKDWSDFFKYTSNIFALLERNSYLDISNPQTILNNFQKEYLSSHKNKAEFSFFQAYKLSKKLKIIKKFEAFTKSLQITAEQINKIPEDGYVLIRIDEIDNTTFGIKSEFFSMNDLDIAVNKYMELEKKSILHENFITALISTDSIGGIKEAYPNYFADSSSFIKYFQIITRVYEEYNPIWYRFICHIKFLFK